MNLSDKAINGLIVAVLLSFLAIGVFCLKAMEKLDRVDDKVAADQAVARNTGRIAASLERMK